MIKSNEIEIQVEIESNCGLNCKHCSSIYMRNTKRDDSFFQDQLDLFISAINKPIHLVLTGGEPLLHNQIEIIISKLKKHKNIVDIGCFTCGIVYKKTSENLVNYHEIPLKKAVNLSNLGLNYCYISLYHHIPELHDAITNINGSFQTTIASIKNLQMAQIDVKINLVITKYNVNVLQKLIMFYATLGVSEVRILRLVKSGNAILNWGDIGVTEDEQNNAIIELIKISHDFPVRTTYAGFPELTACRPFPYASKCQAGINLIYITYDGCVYPCACKKNDPSYRIAYLSQLDMLTRFINSRDCLSREHCLNSPI